MLIYVIIFYSIQETRLQETAQQMLYCPALCSSFVCSRTTVETSHEALL